MLEESLALNNYLSQQVKEDIAQLVKIFNKNFPNINLDNFYQKLKTLQIKRISKLICKDISKYDIKENTIYFNIDMVNKDYDMKHVLMYELLNVISSNENKVGFGDATYESLNAGFTEIIANLLVGNEKTAIYKEESVYANIISIMIGVDVLEEAYFKNNSNLIDEALLRIGVKVKWHLKILIRVWII